MTLVWDNNTMRFHEEPISKIWDRLYIGCYYDAMMLRNSNSHGIDLVINLTHDPINFDGKKIQTVNYPMNDGHAVDQETFWDVLNTIAEAAEHGKKVMVHCHAGMSRSVCMVIAYLYVTGFLPWEQCIDYVKEKRPVAQPHEAILKSMKKHLKIFPYDGTLGEPVR